MPEQPQSQPVTTEDFIDSVMAATMGSQNASIRNAEEINALKSRLETAVRAAETASGTGIQGERLPDGSYRFRGRVRQWVVAPDGKISKGPNV